MKAVINWLGTLFGNIPLPLLEVWGRFSYVVGFALALWAFGGFTFRIGSRWGFGRERQAWDAKAFLAIPVTFVAILASGWLGSFIVLVPGAQTFESLKDLVVFLCIVLLGYPALITVPFAYGLSDLIEGVPPDFLLDWLPGYFINPACFWIAYQLFGKSPEFRRARTWLAYLVFVSIFMALEPTLWGYICSDQFTSAVSYRVITPALFFTTGITWVLAPAAMLVTLPLARKLDLFWAEAAGHVRERVIWSQEWAWEAGKGAARVSSPGTPARGLPIRMVLLGPFVALVLMMVAVTAYVTLRSAEDDAGKLATRIHQEVSHNIELQLDEYLARSQGDDGLAKGMAIKNMLASLAIAEQGRALIVDRSSRVVASSAAASDPIVVDALAALAAITGSAGLESGVEFRFDHVAAKSPSRETWLAHANPYRDRSGEHASWILVTALPESFYLAGIREGNSRSAMVFAVALLLALAIAALLAYVVGGPLQRIALATQALARGDLSERVPSSGVEELGALAESFNTMAAQLEKDVTEQRNAEQELRRHRDHLEELVSQRTREADAANRAKGAFLANMSHEIRTPMNAILGFGHLMERESDLSRRNRERLDKILTSGAHLLELINNVLEMSKIEAGRLVLSASTFDLQRAIADVDAMFRDSIEGKGLTLTITGVDALPRYVRTDGPKLRQVLINLVGNAAKFTTQGGVTVRASSGRTGEQIKLRFEVQDTGVGIAADELDRVFEPFAQTASGMASRVGTGLGVPISRNVARLMGGDLTVRSQVGVGTVFELEVLAQPGDPAEIERADVSVWPVIGIEEGQKRPLVLVVDDEQDNRLLLAELLGGVGIEVVEAPNGAIALERFVQIEPDLVLMDWKMPVMDGLEATRAIRATPHGAKVPIIVLSASVLGGEQAAALDASADAFVSKPFQAAEIWHALETHLGLRFVRRIGGAPGEDPAHVTREQVAALGDETVATLREALETGYPDRVPGLLAGAGREHATVVAALCRLAASFEIDRLMKLL